MTAIQRVLFLGSKKLGLQCLKQIHAVAPEALLGVLTIDDRKDTRSEYDVICAFAAEHGLPLRVAENRGHSERLIRQWQPEMCLVVGWYWLISKQTLDAVPAGFLGIHPSLLPKYRGASPLVWAVINGDAQVGASLFSFTEGMDDGDVWWQCTVEVGPDDYVCDLLARIESEAVGMLRTHYLDILNRRIRPVPQDHARATFCAQRLPADGEIDWKKPARDVHNFVRAQSEPYPGAFTYVDGDKKLTVWRARLVDLPYCGTPGQVARIGSEGVYVVCGDQRPVLLQVVEVEGGPREAAQRVLKSGKIRLSGIIPRHALSA